ncbi:MAG: hypothetical protein HYT76_01645 [Deltaproteobacteria bacterium]|nr:hypothetical protein [Deltaproteobacteria bacterium]
MPRPLSWPRTILAAADPAHSASVCSRFIDLSHEIGPARGRIVMASSADEFAVLLERLPFENASHVLRFGGYTIGIGILVSAYFYLNNHSNGNAKPIDLQIVCFSMLSSSLTIALAYVAKITSPTRLLPAGASILSAMIVASGIDYLLRSSTLSSQKS